PSAADMARVVRDLGLLQIDSVNVVVPAHYLVMFSRLGPYDRATLDKVIYRSGQFTEQWAHEACILPVEAFPLLRHRMTKHRPPPWGLDKYMDQYTDYVHWVLEQVRVRGPLSGDQLDPPEGSPRKIPNSWYSNVGRGVLEAHFGRGILAVANRGLN